MAHVFNEAILGVSVYMIGNEIARRGYFGQNKIVLPNDNDVKYSQVRIKPSRGILDFHNCSYWSAWSDETSDVTCRHFHRPIQMEYNGKDITDECIRKLMNYP